MNKNTYTILNLEIKEGWPEYSNEIIPQRALHPAWDDREHGGYVWSWGETQWKYISDRTAWGDHQKQSRSHWG